MSFLTGEVFLSRGVAWHNTGVCRTPQVQTVEQATQVALDLVRKYYSFAFPISARKETTRWIVDLDISYFKPSYVRVRIFAETGVVEDFRVTLGPLL